MTGDDKHFLEQLELFRIHYPVFSYFRDFIDSDSQRVVDYALQDLGKGNTIKWGTWLLVKRALEYADKLKATKLNAKLAELDWDSDYVYDDPEIVSMNTEIGKIRPGTNRWFKANLRRQLLVG